jgi:hypothetical protein
MKYIYVFIAIFLATFFWSIINPRPLGYIDIRIARKCFPCPHMRAGKVFVANCNRHRLQICAIQARDLLHIRAVGVSQNTLELLIILQDVKLNI